jgi:hypothetical protein
MLKIWRRMNTDHKVILLILLSLVGLKIPFTLSVANILSTGIDGGYYLDVAQNVRDGLGLRTDISIFHHGMPFFPHPTSTYPLWPLLLGYTGRLVPLEQLAFWLPTLFYLSTLLIAWRVGRGLFPGTLFIIGGLEFNAGHLLALILGIHVNFFMATSTPYTEGLAYTLVMLALLRSRSFLKANPLIGGIEMGIWAALIFLSRSQLLIFSLAAVVFIGVESIFNDWKRGSGLLLGFALGFSIIFGPEYLYLRSFSAGEPLQGYLKVHEFRVTNHLGPWDFSFRTTGVLDFIKDRLRGVIIAFLPFNESRCYFNSLSFIPYSFLPVIPLLFTRIRRYMGDTNVILSLDESRELWRKWRPQIFFIIFAIIGMVSLHLIHISYWEGWIVGRRHGITAVFIFFLSIVLLFRSHRYLRFLAIVILLLSLLNTCLIYSGSYRAIDKQSWVFPRIVGLIAFLNDRSSQEERPIVIAETPLAKRLAPFTPNTAYHEMVEQDQMREVEIYFRQFKGELLLLIPNDGFTKRLIEQGLLEKFDLLEHDVSGVDVYNPRKDWIFDE